MDMTMLANRLLFQRTIQTSVDRIGEEFKTIITTLITPYMTQVLWQVIQRIPRSMMMGPTVDSSKER
jgi:hypothetical protein